MFQQKDKTNRTSECVAHLLGTSQLLKSTFSIWHDVKADVRHSFQIEAKLVTFHISSEARPLAVSTMSRVVNLLSVSRD